MKKIFLVEDDAFLSKMYVEKLSQTEEFAVRSFEFGKSALLAMEKEAPDLLLLDIILPDINGIQILKKMKENESLKSVPVLLLTNLNEKDYIDEALSLGAAGYLIKAHFTPNEVIDKIRQIMRF